MILALLAASCAPMQKRIADMQSQEQLSKYRYYMASGFYDTVIRQCRQVLRESETKPPADLALYVLGEVYANYSYKGKNYQLSRQYFQKLLTNFPYSPLASEAKTYLGLYAVLDAKDRTIAALQEKNARAEAAAAEAEKTSEATALPHPVVENRNFEEAVRKNELILREAGNSPPADEALYNLGLIYANNDNPAKNYGKARKYFALLTKKFPDSPLAEEAQIWLGLFNVFEKMRQIDVDIEQQKKQLNR